MDSSGRINGESTYMSDLIAAIYDDTYERQLDQPNPGHLVDDLLEIMLDVSKRRSVEVEVDPYEIYKDDEGYDYVFVG